jgi:PAS domain S-box-containing protein
MKYKSLHRLFIGIILPAIIAIILFFVSVWLIIIPIVEKNMMNNKKEMIGELTHTAWSLIDEFYHDYRDSIYTKSEAQRLAISKVELMRYGKESKDYFWISDMSPKMVMHPYRKDLNGKSLEDYEDPNGFKLFVEAARIAEESGEGYLDYYWQLREDSSRIVQKISYVKAFPQWDWIVGTGIYIEDVRRDISALKNQIIRISVGITFIIALILLFIIRQSFRIENKRNQAETDLKSSREKFKSLVEAATEGTLLFIDNKVSYANQTFSAFSGFNPEQVLNLKFDDLFDLSWESILEKIDEPEKSVTMQDFLTDVNGKKKEIILSLSKTYAQNETRIIATIRELGTHQRMKIAETKLGEDVENALAMMVQSASHFAENIISCDSEISISEAASKMTRMKKSFILIAHKQRYIGFVSQADICNRAISSGMAMTDAIGEIMTAPIPLINNDALLPELIQSFNQENTNYLFIKDSQNVITKAISKNTLANLETNAISVLIQEIRMCQSENDLKSIFMRVPVIVKGLIRGGVKAENLVRLISSIVDQIGKRTVELVIEDIGEAPCDFAFFALGSEARDEQSFLTDQDNAIVFDDKYADDENVKSYFHEMANRINVILNSAGINLCEGEVMANNPKWNQPASVWKSYFTKWINKSDPESLLDSSIFFDMKLIYGNKEFVAELQQHILTEVKNKAVFFQHLAQTIIQIKLPSVSNQTSFNIKKIMLPISGFARIYSLQLNDYEANTFKRIRAAAEKEKVTKVAERELLQVYEFLLNKRLNTQADLILSGEKASNEIDGRLLSEFEISVFKKSISIISDYQSQLSADFKGMV